MRTLEGASKTAATYTVIFSIITVTKNGSSTVEKAAHSVRNQKNVSTEHILKDGESTDDTIKVARSANPDIKAYSSKDIGIYDAMNQGLKHASGDIVAFLNSDDIYSYDTALSDVQSLFESTGADIVYGNIEMRTPSGKVARKWSTGKMDTRIVRRRQIPHPALFIRRKLLESLTPAFDPSYKIAADLKQQLILISKRTAKVAYLDKTTTIMLTGGTSTRDLRAYVLSWRESRRAYNEVFGRGGTFYVLQKVLAKLKTIR